jgi:predicted amidohydrolase
MRSAVCSDLVLLALPREAPCIPSPTGRRLQHISKTRVECRGLAEMRADDERLVDDWNLNPCHQKSRDITNLEKRRRRVRIPASPPVFLHFP